MARNLIKTIPDLRQNQIINGDMRISQRASSFVSPAGGDYTLDRWVYGKTSSNTHTVSQDTDVPTLAQSGFLFQNSLRMNLTGADTSIAAGDFNWIMQKIEGINFVKLAQKPFTLSFWVKATLTGTYCVSFSNSATDRTYVAEYTINATNTWEKKTITVAASPAAGTWNYSNGEGLRVAFTVACGTTFQTTANAWQTGSFYGTSNQVNGVNTGATDFRITGVVINEGSSAAPFNYFGGSLDAEFKSCQRYYLFLANVGIRAFTTAAGQLQRDVRIYPVAMRSTPTLTKSSLNQSVTNISAESIDTYMYWIDATSTGASSTTRYIFDAVFNAEL